MDFPSYKHRKVLNPVDTNVQSLFVGMYMYVCNTFARLDINNNSNNKTKIRSFRCVGVFLSFFVHTRRVSSRRAVNSAVASMFGDKDNLWLPKL